MKKSEWSYQTIDCLCNKINGLWKGKKEPFIKVGVIRNANFTKEFTLCFDNIEYLDVEERQYSSRKLQKGDIIVEKSGGSEKQPVGRCVLFDKDDGDFSFSNFTSVLRIKNRSVISPEYLYKYMLFVYRRGDTRAMQKAATGIHNIEFDKFLAILIPVPPLAEQQEIVDYLDKAFAKIDALKKNAEQQLSDAKALFSAALEESMSPKKGWGEYEIGNVIDHLRTGLNPRTHFKLNTPDATGYYITVRELKGGSIEPDAKTDKINSSALMRINQRSKLKIGDVLFSGTGTIGKTALVSELPNTWNIKEGVYAMTPKKHLIDSMYMIYYISADFFLTKVHEKASGTGVQSIPMKELVKLPIFLPDLPTQQAIAAHLDALSSKVNQLQENYNKILRECDALKQALLREIFEQ